MKYLWLVLLLCSCAPVPKNKVSIAPELQSYVDSFVSDGKSMGKTVKITSLVVELGDLDTGQIGLCSLKSGMPTVTISLKHYNYFIQYKKQDDLEEIVYHELGHCLLGKQHASGFTALSQFPASIMVPLHFSGLIYKTYKQNYLRELFLNTNENF